MFFSCLFSVNCFFTIFFFWIKDFYKINNTVVFVDPIVFSLSSLWETACVSPVCLSFVLFE